MMLRKRKLFVLISALLLLALIGVACGKTESKEDAKSKVEKEVVDKKDDKDENKDIVSDKTEELVTDTENNTETNKTDKKTEDAEKAEDSNKNETSVSNKTENKTDVESSENKNNTTQSTQKPQENTKKSVERISEEVKSGVVPYKFGVTKQDITVNDYMLYSDNSKELLTSYTYTAYDSSGFRATDAELKLEAELGVTRYNNYYQEVLRLVNKIRAEVGVGPMTLDTTLCKAASMRALEMDYANVMSHTRPNGTDCWTVFDFYNVSFMTCGENVAAGQTSPSAVVEGWKNSQGHYENMINPAFTKLGVGYSSNGVGSMKHYWCQLFTN